MTSHKTTPSISRIYSYPRIGHDRLVLWLLFSIVSTLVTVVCVITTWSNADDVLLPAVPSVRNKMILPTSTEEMLIHVVPPISNKMILPSTFPLPGEPSQVIDIVACRGEYEPASFVVRSSIQDMVGLQIEATDLVGTSGMLPKDVIDIRIVKVWYQGGGGWDTIEQTRLGRASTFVPELLVKDDQLVKVDHATKHNQVRLHFPAGAKHISTHNLASGKAHLVVPAEEFPIRDAVQLQPIDIPRNETRQFWITLHVPNTAASGSYLGKVFLKQQGTLIGSINLQVTVLPFDLPPPSVTYSLYYRGQLSDKPTISSELKNRTQFEAEMRNMIAHGVSNPTIYQRLDRTQLNAVLTIRESVGMVPEKLFYLGTSTGNPNTSKDLEALSIRIKYLLSIPAVSRFREIYIYGIDEAKGEKLSSQLQAWKLAHSNGLKIFSAGYKGTFDRVGSMLDLLIFAGRPNQDEIRKFHAAGNKVYSYANPQVGPENPYVFRKNYGFELWRNGYDGAMTYAYQHSMGFIWNDVDHSTYRDHVFAYPTVDGVIDTLAWEGFREGVDDVRYITTLEKSLANVQSSHNADKYGLIVEVNNFLDELRGYSAHDLDGMRRRIVSYIIELQKE